MRLVCNFGNFKVKVWEFNIIEIKKLLREIF